MTRFLFSWYFEMSKVKHTEQHLIYRIGLVKALHIIKYKFSHPLQMQHNLNPYLAHLDVGHNPYTLHFKD